jgi:putative OPT family oligopeptide transporter
MRSWNPVTRRGLHPTAYQAKDGEEYVPYVREGEPRELTAKALLCGVILGVVFGAANTYLGLMAGLTISTSIPVAVLTVVVFRALTIFTARHSILEANMSQTVGSASSSVASGVLFTIPALFLWGMKPGLLQLTCLAMAGGLLGVLLMVPLRRYLIRREHGKLPYPEGMACAEVLVASEGGGRQASGVFWGLGVGALFKWLTDGGKLVASKWGLSAGRFSVAVKVSPALIGVGYILGVRVASVMVGGAALSSFVIIPIIAWWGGQLDAPFYPEMELLIRHMDAGQIWNRYVRYIGAGAVGAAGILTLIRSFPMMVESIKLGVSHLGSSERSAQTRTDDDLSLKVVAGLIVAVLLLLILSPGVLGFLDDYLVKAVAALLIAVFAFFFVTVSSRIVGLVGVTSNPTSGMTIAALLGTSFTFYLMGWTDLAGKATALMVGTSVCIAASIAGDTSQDLKTGFLLGATPRRQQLGEILGVMTSTFFVCWTVSVLDASLGLGSKELPAPQATLMKLVISGVIEQNLPWTLILIGVGITAVAAWFRLPLLAFAVGVYLPLSTMAPVFIGGMLRYLLTRKRDEATSRSRRENGVLFASGLVGGEGLMGVLVAFYVLIQGGKKLSGFSLGLPTWAESLVSLIAIGAIGYLLSLAARKKLFSGAGAGEG